MSGMSRDLYHKISAKTSSYAITKMDLGTLFTNRGASGAVTFTLPLTTGLETGWHCRIFAVADQNVVIASYGSSDNIVTFNDAGADSITISTASEIMGAGYELVWDGTGWLAFSFVGETQTVTIA